MWGSPQGATFKPWGMGVDVSLPAHWEDSEASSSQNLRTSQNQQD